MRRIRTNPHRKKEEKEIANLKKPTKEFFTSRDLVRLGVFSSDDEAYEARKRGRSPDYYKIGRRVLYSKDQIEAFLSRSKE